MNKLNDYELLYLIKENDTHAYNLMVEKYSKMIMIKIKSFGVYEKDEFFQEGLIVLDKAIKTFKEEYNKTFTRYFEKLLINKFINLKRKEKIEYSFDEDFYVQNNYILEEIVCEYEAKEIEKCFSDIEKDIYIDYYIEKASIDYLSNKYNIDTAKVYYYVRRIKNKIKKMSHE